MVNVEWTYFSQFEIWTLKLQNHFEIKIFKQIY